MSVNLDAEAIEILTEIAKVQCSTNHSRTRVYPQLIADSLRLTPPAAIDTWSAWAALIPVATVTMDYNIAGILIENWQGKEFFEIQLARSATPAVADYVGEMRFNTPIADDWSSTIPIIIKTGKIPSGTGIWGRIKARTNAAYWVDFSLVLQRWLIMDKEMEPDAAWPW
jgi:hypothetical protein